MKFCAGPSSFKPNESSALLTPKEAEFREYLSQSKAVDEIVRLLVGLAESAERPENPVANWRAMFDTERAAFKEKPHLLHGMAGPQVVSGTTTADEDIPALLAENDALRAREAELSAALEDAIGRIEAREASAAAKVIDALVASGAFASERVEGALDASKLCAHMQLPRARICGERTICECTHARITTPARPFLARECARRPSPLHALVHCARSVPRAQTRASRHASRRPPRMHRRRLHGPSRERPPRWAP